MFMCKQKLRNGHVALNSITTTDFTQCFYFEIILLFAHRYTSCVVLVEKTSATTQNIGVPNLSDSTRRILINKRNRIYLANFSIQCELAEKRNDTQLLSDSQERFDVLDL